MSDAVWVSLIAAVPASIAAAVGFFTRSMLQEVGHRVDGRLEELLAIARTKGFEAGVRQETDKKVKRKHNV